MSRGDPFAPESGSAFRTGDFILISKRTSTPAEDSSRRTTATEYVNGTRLLLILEKDESGQYRETQALPLSEAASRDPMTR